MKRRTVKLVVYRGPRGGRSHVGRYMHSISKCWPQPPTIPVHQSLCHQWGANVQLIDALQPECIACARRLTKFVAVTPSSSVFHELDGSLRPRCGKGTSRGRSTVEYLTRADAYFNRLAPCGLCANAAN